MIDFKAILEESKTQLAQNKASLSMITDSIKKLSEELNIPLDANLPNEVAKQTSEVKAHIESTQKEMDLLIKELEECE